MRRFGVDCWSLYGWQHTLDTVDTGSLTQLLPRHPVSSADIYAVIGPDGNLD